MDFEWERPAAFIIYHPASGRFGESILYNREAMDILSHPSSFHEQDGATFELTALCNTWKFLLEKNIATARKNSVDAPESFFLDLFKSGSRRYRVKGFLLHNHQQEKKNISFMFAFSRIHHGSVNLEKKFRESRLSRREQEIVHLIMTDKSNKEIADAIGLSVNTVKGYLKLLMRKLSVTSKAGIIAHFMKKTPSSPPQS
ncbi:MAG: helix-turn-helix transcriptional regulator [Desulfobulbaceae bacterium]